MTLHQKTALGMSLPHRSPDPLTLTTLEATGRDPTKFPVSKRAFMAVDERPAVARRELERWFIEVYPNPPGIDASGIHGTPEQVRERFEELVVAGAKHLLLNPISRHAEQLEAVAESRRPQIAVAFVGDGTSCRSNARSRSDVVVPRKH